MELVFFHFAAILFVAFAVSFIIKYFKQPLIIGYIIAGFLIGPFIAQSTTSTDVLTIFSKFGIAFLLFIVGLHLNPKVIREIGFTSFLLGLAQIIFTFFITFVIAFYALSFGLVASAYIAIALSFSSTIIIMKLLSDKRELQTLPGKIAVGVLIIQDLVAVFVLMIISSLSGGASVGSVALKALLGGGGLIIVLFLLGLYLLPKLLNKLATTQELLFLFSLCWCFVVAALFSFVGFSFEIGALIAGVVLSLSPYSVEISAKIRPLRDFFLIVFFIILGFNIDLDNLGSIIVPAIIFALIALLIKPFLLMAFSALLGYTRRTNFKVGTTLAQISEFSLIVVALGVGLGHISSRILSIIVLGGLLSIAVSSYWIINADTFYQAFGSGLKIFERKKIRERRQIHKKYDAVLFGYNRIGFSILRALKHIKKNYLVIDFNPEVTCDLQKMRIPCLYGDAYDADLLSELPLDKLKLAISTIPDLETNKLLIDAIKKVNKNAMIIARASTVDDALDLYAHGANYVLTPHLLGGEYVARMIQEEKFDPRAYEKEKKEHLETLRKRKRTGLV